MSKKKIIIIASVIASIIIIVATVLLVVLLPSEGYRNIKAYSVEGTVLVERDDKKIECYSEMSFRSGDEISVNDESSLIIRLDGDKFIKLNENTKLELISSERDSSKTIIRLMEGSTIIELKNKLGNDSFRVECPSSSMAIRGTVAYISVTKDGANTLASYSLAEGSALVSTYKRDGEKYLVLEAPMLSGSTVNMEISPNDLLKPDAVGDINDRVDNDDPKAKKNSYSDMADLIKNENRIKINRSPISDEIKDKTYRELDKFKEASFSLTTIGASFKVVDTDIANQISYEANEAFNVVATPDTVDGMEFSGWILNGKEIAVTDNPYNLLVDSKIKLEAKFKEAVPEIIQYSISVKGGLINGKSSATVPAGTELRVIADNPNNYVISSILINEKPYEIVNNEITLTANMDMNIEFIYDIKSRYVNLENAYAEGHKNESRLILPLNSKIRVRALNNAVVESFTINGETKLSDLDFIDLVVDKNLTISAKALDCLENQVRLKTTGVNIIKADTLTKDNLIDRGSLAVVEAAPPLDYELDYYLYNNQRIETKKLNLSIDIAESTVIEAVFKKIVKHKVSVENGTIVSIDTDGLTEGMYKHGEELYIAVANPNNMNIEGVIINGVNHKDINASFYTNANSDMTISFVLTNNPPVVRVYSDKEHGRVLVNDKDFPNEFIELKDLAKGATINISAEAMPGYRFEGFYNREYGEPNRYLIGSSENINLTVNNNYTIYPSFMKIEKYKLVDTSGNIDISSPIIQVLPGEMKDIDFNSLRLYRYDEGIKEYVGCDEGFYRLLVGFVEVDQITSPDAMSRVISLNEVSTNRSGAYTIEAISHNHECYTVESLAKLLIVVSKDIDIPKELIRINIGGEELSIVPNSSFGHALNSYGMGLNNRTIVTDSLKMGVLKVDNQEFVALYEDAFTDPIRTTDGTNIFKGFSFTVADGYTLYYYDSSTGYTAEYPAGSEIPLDQQANGKISFIVTSNRHSMEQLSQDIFIDGVVFDLMLVDKTEAILSAGENKLYSINGDRDVAYSSIPLPHMAKELAPVLGENNEVIKPARLQVAVNQVLPPFKLDGSYHNSDGSLTITMTNGTYFTNLRYMDGKAIASNSDGLYVFDLMASKKCIIEETIPGKYGDYKQGINILVYEFMVDRGNDSLIIELLYYVQTPNARQYAYDELLNYLPEFAEAFNETNESLGYDEALYNYYFVEGGGGYDIPLMPDTNTPQTK